MNIGTIFNRIYDYSLKKINPLKFKNIIDTNFKNPKSIVLSSKYLYNELPIRLSHRITDLNNLPFGLSHNHSINKIREWYVNSFCDLINFKEPKTIEDSIKFGEVIDKIYQRHSSTMVVMSKGIIELKNEDKISDINCPNIQSLLNRFYKNRLEIRILLEQYLNLCSNPDNKSLIEYDINLKDIIVDAINNIKYTCQFNNIDLDVQSIIKIQTLSLINNNNVTVIGLSNYLYYIFFELIKNSVDAVNKKQKLLSNTFKPQIDIQIIEIDKDNIIIRLSDNGIGIKEENLDKIWYYSYSSNPINPKDIIERNDYNNLAPLSGFGYGLPISELYLQFFNNQKHNIKIESKYQNYTTTYISIKKHNMTIY